ncbi:hypothetical protein ABTL11_19630, partial [Acinetobacter baumannii]
YTLRGRELVDGGILAPLPITATRLSGAHRLIAVDMHGWPAGPPGRLARPSPAELPRAAAALPASLLTRWLRRFGGEAAAVDMAGSARAI